MSQPIHRKHSPRGHTPSKSVTHKANQHTMLPTNRHINTRKQRRYKTNHSYNQSTSTHASQHVTQETGVRTSHQTTHTYSHRTCTTPPHVTSTCQICGRWTRPRAKYATCEFWSRCNYVPCEYGHDADICVVTTSRFKTLKLSNPWSRRNYVPCEYGHGATMCRVNMVTTQISAP